MTMNPLRRLPLKYVMSNNITSINLVPTKDISSGLDIPQHIQRMGLMIILIADRTSEPGSRTIVT